MAKRKDLLLTEATTMRMMGLAGIGGAQHSGDGRTGELGHDGAYVVQDGGQGKDFARSARCSVG